MRLDASRLLGGRVPGGLLQVGGGREQLVRVVIVACRGGRFVLDGRQAELIVAGRGQVFDRVRSLGLDRVGVEVLGHRLGRLLDLARVETPLPADRGKAVEGAHADLGVSSELEELGQDEVVERA